MLGTLSMILVFYLCLSKVINPQLSGAIYTNQSFFIGPRFSECYSIMQLLELDTHTDKYFRGVRESWKERTYRIDYLLSNF